MPILLAPLYEPVVVERLAMKEKEIRRLASLGILVGTEVTVLDNASGSVILRVKDGRLALDHDTANRILVRIEQ